MKQLSLRQLSLRYAWIVLGVVVVLSLASFASFQAWTVRYHVAAVEQNLVIKVADIARVVEQYREIVSKLARQQKLVDLLVFGSEQEASAWALSMQDFLPYNIGLAMFGADGNVMGNPVELRLGRACVMGMNARMHDSTLQKTPVHDAVASLAHFDVVENVVADDRVVGLIFASFSLEILQKELARITPPDYVLSIYSEQQQSIATAGNIDGRRMLLEKVTLIPGTGWTLRAAVAEQPMGALLVQTTLLAAAMFMLVSVVWYLFTRRMVVTFATDLGSIQQLLAHVKDNHASPAEPMRSKMQETQHIVEGIYNLAQDISHYQQRLLSFSTTDELTGLLNRHAFYQQVPHCIELARRGLDVSLVALDLDYFKQANDMFGHAVGDDLLKAFARCMQRNMRATDLTARLGGDEFAVVLMQCNEEQAFLWYSKMAKEFETLQQEMFAVAASIRLCSISAGFTHVTEQDKDINTVLKRADDALYKAKGAGRGRMVS